MIKLIAAIDQNNGLGFNNKLPWKYNEDMSNFKKLTIGDGNNAVIMGKNTWISIGKLLPKRSNYIISTTLNNKNYNIFKNLDIALNELKKKKYDNIWIIGGAKLYKTALENNYAEELYITKINNTYNCDVFFPNILTKYKLKKNIILSNSCKLYIYHKI